MDVPIRTGGLETAHRSRLATILRDTGVFSDAEVAVGLELFDDAISHQRPHGSTPLAPSPSANERDSDPDYSVLGAFTPDDELVGYACWGPTPGTDRTCDLYWIAVHPSAHGAGIGSRLLSKVERRLQARHARMLIVETSSRSAYAPTRAFYERRGYTESARVRDFYAPGDDRIILAKRLHQSRHDGGEYHDHE